MKATNKIAKLTRKLYVNGLEIRETQRNLMSKENLIEKMYESETIPQAVFDKQEGERDELEKKIDLLTSNERKLLQAVEDLTKTKKQLREEVEADIARRKKKIEEINNTIRKVLLVRDREEDKILELEIKLEQEKMGKKKNSKAKKKQDKEDKKNRELARKRVLAKKKKNKKTKKAKTMEQEIEEIKASTPKVETKVETKVEVDDTKTKETKVVVDTKTETKPDVETKIEIKVEPTVETKPTEPKVGEPNITPTKPSKETKEVKVKPTIEPTIKPTIEKQGKKKTKNKDKKPKLDMTKNVEDMNDDELIEYTRRRDRDGKKTLKLRKLNVRKPTSSGDEKTDSKIEEKPNKDLPQQNKENEEEKNNEHKIQEEREVQEDNNEEENGGKKSLLKKPNILQAMVASLDDPATHDLGSGIKLNNTFEENREAHIQWKVQQGFPRSEPSDSHIESLINKAKVKFKNITGKSYEGNGARIKKPSREEIERKYDRDKAAEWREMEQRMIDSQVERLDREDGIIE